LPFTRVTVRIVPFENTPTGRRSLPVPERLLTSRSSCRYATKEANVDGLPQLATEKDYPNFSITVIDDGSTDATPHLLEQWKARDRRIQVHRIDELPDDWAGKPHALHTGATLANGEWLRLRMLIRATHPDAAPHGQVCFVPAG